MEISKDLYNKIQNMIQMINKDPNYEFEARIGGKNFTENTKMDFYKFENILNNLIFSKDLGGYGLKYTIETTLDVQFSDYRLTINGKDDVKRYWLMGELSDEINYKFIKKKNINKIDIDEYNVRLSLSSEDKLDNKTVLNLLNQLKDNKKMKTYRLKNRHYITSTDGLFRFDLTSIKMADGVSFQKSNIFRKMVDYEVELEYIGDYKNDIKNIFEELFKNINILLKLYHNNEFIVKNSEIEEVLNSYKKLITYSNYVNNPLFIVANPVTLHKINLVESYNPNIVNDYAVTLKADGVRNLLFILNSSDQDLNGNIYLLDSSLGVKFTGFKNEDWAGSLIEGEFIKSDNLFLAYDILYEKGNDIRNLPLVDVKSSRLGYLGLCIKSIGIKEEGLIIKSKEYKYGGNIFEKISDLWENRENYEYDVDGLIFTPIKEKYPNRVGTWTKLFKWKPPKFNSFDFLIKVEKNEKGKDIKSPYIIYKENGESVIYQYKTLVLYVGKSEYDNKNNKKRTYKAVEFNPLGEDDPSNINRAKIVLDRGEKMVAHDPITGKYSEIIDDTIVEFVYDKSQKDFRWVPIRIRHDKTQRYKSGENIFGNNEKTANDIWKSVNNPLTFEELSLGRMSKEDAKEDIGESDTSYYACQVYEPEKRLPLQNFHNLVVKMNLIKDVAPKEGGKLLDLACGKAGDLSKWSNAKYEEVVSIDIDKKCLEYAMEYYENYKNINKPKVVFIWGDTSKLIFPTYVSALNPEAKSLMRDNLSSKYMFDVVSCQFCVHYYFENEIKLRTLLQNINDNLKIGGYLIGTCFDGERIVEAMKGKNMIEGKMNDKLIWKIEKLYKAPVFNSVRSQYGKEINVFVSSINNDHKEYLVNFKFFENMLKEYGLEKVKVVEFAEIYEKMDKNNNSGKVSKMSEVEKDFSFLNNMFIFKKTKNAPDSLYKKLQTLMEKNKENTSGTKKIKIKKI